MGVWRPVTIAGKAADAFEPSRPGANGGAALFLHGHGQITLKDNAVYSAELDRYGLRCLCPNGKRSWWGDRVCREFDETLTPMAFLREHVLPWLALNWNVAPPTIALFGVSMGGQGALKLAYRWPEQFPVVAALAPAIDFQNWYGRGLPLDEIYNSAEAARQDTATLLLHPLNWPRHQLLMCDPADIDWIDGAERLASKLVSTGIPFESDFETSHGGHSWEYFNHVAPRVVRFLHEGLEKERLRLPIAPAGERG